MSLFSDIRDIIERAAMKAMQATGAVPPLPPAPPPGATSSDDAVIQRPNLPPEPANDALFTGDVTPTNLFGEIADIWGGGGGQPPDEPGETGGPEEDDFHRYLYLGEWVFTPQSSNVYSFQYNRDNEVLVVGYCGWAGARDESTLRFYEYYAVDESEAIGAYQALSKGEWVWDELRIRGTKCGHHKHYAYLSAMSLYRPKNPC